MLKRLYAEWPELNDGFTFRDHIKRTHAGMSLLDFYTTQHPASGSSSEWLARVARGQVAVNGAVVEDAQRLLRVGDVVSYTRTPWREPPSPSHVDVVYEDEHMVALSKPPGLQVLPAAMFHQRTVLALLRAHYGAAGVGAGGGGPAAGEAAGGERACCGAAEAEAGGGRPAAAGAAGGEGASMAVPGSAGEGAAVEHAGGEQGGGDESTSATSPTVGAGAEDRAQAVHSAVPRLPEAEASSEAPRAAPDAAEPAVGREARPGAEGCGKGGGSRRGRAGRPRAGAGGGGGLLAVPAPVHRLGRGTSGLLLCARTAESRRRLTELMTDKTAAAAAEAAAAAGSAAAGVAAAGVEAAAGSAAATDPGSAARSAGGGGGPPSAAAAGTERVLGEPHPHPHPAAACRVPLRKVYRALVQGLVGADQGRVDAPIGPIAHPGVDGGLFAATPDGKPAASVWRLLERRPAEAEAAGPGAGAGAGSAAGVGRGGERGVAGEESARQGAGASREEGTSGRQADEEERRLAAGRSLLEVEILTGRPHQIRIHTAFMGHPLVGDPLYGVGGRPKLGADAAAALAAEGEGAGGGGGAAEGCETAAADPHLGGFGRPGDCGYHLHSMELSLPHPITGQRLTLRAPPPPLLQTAEERAGGGQTGGCSEGTDRASLSTAHCLAPKLALACNPRPSAAIAGTIQSSATMAGRVDARTLELQAPASKIIFSTHIEPRDDMAAERARATFDVKELTYAMNGGKDKLEKRMRFADILDKTEWGNKANRYFLSREEEYVGGLKAALGIWEKMKSESLSLEDGALMRTLVDFPGGLELHIGMFIPSIMSQGDPEQQAKWMPLCMGLKIIGTYAQTELGHGTFVRGLETTATYDPQAQEFVIHSPTLTATKWWPGGLGKTATHAIVMARLMVPDGKGGAKDYGPHGFVAQIRDMATHLPLPGVKIGDIGPKAGFNSVDNGYMSFDHVRIPRDHMLMRFSKVTPEGRYVPPPPSNSKASYATMVFVRADIVKNSGQALARAVTIAVRYAAVRRQTAPAPGARELQVLDYQNCAASLLPLLAASYALTFMGDAMMAMYKQFEADRDKGQFGALPELHALSSGLKAVCTWVAADGIEECRRCCGGHGFSRLSGLPTLFLNYVQNVTWEGDNNVLCLQTARYLIKTIDGVRSSGKRAAGSAAYLNDLTAELATTNRCAATCDECWSDPTVAAAALRHVATRAVAAAEATLRRASGARGLVFEGAPWNENTIDFIRSAKAHCALVLHATFLEGVARLEGQRALGPQGAAVLRQLAALFALDSLQRGEGLAMLLEAGYLSAAQAQALRRRHAWLLAAVRPNAVGLVDAFGLPDYLLNSALGRADGDVYRGLLEMAEVSPLNATQEGPAWEGVLKPLLAPRSRL
ncbi:hypothetical protein HYH03_012598 [Edaphochlamys debaryana]|uniref:Acyl-coenzyme A oxidase n=1 Tax=Edaphochlamys debaryana TaxID=47281 RepID=A0A835XTM8_9CHLO|nr:hypothetical protein HYH03_012598 [Edaphochlamys debaryana]|eukprot:KAG2488798.1 hypothetical protein HYH03_012598 [Edaphochlamys debaryana]